MSEHNPFIITADSTRASERTPQEWVDFYLDLEAKVAEAKLVRSDVLSRTVEMHDLEEIRKARREWQRVVRRQQLEKSGCRHINGLRYSVPDLSR